MRFRPRLPVTPDQIEDQRTPEEVQPTHPNPPTEIRASQSPAADPLTGAFEAVARIVRDEMKSLRQDMIARVEALREGQHKALADFVEQTKSSLAGLGEQVRKAREHTQDRSEEVRAGLEQILSEKERQLGNQMSSMNTALTDVRQNLEAQIATSGQVSSLLNNMANVFAEQRKLPDEPHAQPQPSPQPKNTPR